MGVHIVIVLYYTARPKVEVEIRQVESMQNHLFSHEVCFFIFFLTLTMYIEDYSGVWTSIRERDSGPGDRLSLRLFHQELGH